MFTLFSPSKQQLSGGTDAFGVTAEALPGGIEPRIAPIDGYEEILCTGTKKERTKLTGWNNVDWIEALPKSLNTAPALPALDRYTGVGYRALAIATLTSPQRRYLEQNVIIISDLLGPVRGSDSIPQTQCKPTVRLRGISLPSHYAQHVATAVHKLIGHRTVLDLRAQAYLPYYQPKQHTITCTFLKDGKPVSHWSKFYRGRLLRAVAIEQPDTIDELLQIQVPELTLTDTHQQANSTHLTWTINQPT